MANTKQTSSKNTVKNKDSSAALQNDPSTLKLRRASGGGVSKKVPESSKAVTKGKDSGSKSGMTRDKKTSSYPQMAGFWERFLAYFLDGIILGFASSILGSAFFVPFTFTMASGFSWAIFPYIGLSFLVGIFLTTLYYGYFYIYQNGQSLGKKALKIKVVKEDLKSPISWSDTFLREIIGKDFLNRFVFYLGYLWYFMSEKRQTWADSIAKTYVVKVDEKGNTLMGGEKSYEKKPLITFSACGCFLLWIILVVTIVGVVVAVAASEIFKEVNKNNDNDSEIRYNYDNDGSQDLDKSLEEFKKMLEEEGFELDGNQQL